MAVYLRLMARRLIRPRYYFRLLAQAWFPTGRRVDRVLVVSNEPVGGVMAGPAIRSLELARAVAKECEVTLAAPPPSQVDDPRICLLEATIEDFDVLLGALRSHDVVVAQTAAGAAPAIRNEAADQVRRRHVQPAYLRAARVLSHAEGPRLGAAQRRHVRRVHAQCAAADVIICASEKQRDLWLGGLGLSGLIDLESYRRDRTYRAFVDVVPFGVADRPAVHRGPVLKGSGRGSSPTTTLRFGVAGSGDGSTRSPHARRAAALGRRPPRSPGLPRRPASRGRSGCAAFDGGPGGGLCA
jgi:hypothetical protein